MASVRSLCLLLAMFLSVSLTLESSRAEDGYEIFSSWPGSRYKLYTNALTWTEALSLCHKDGGGSHLVMINSQLEAYIAIDMFARITDVNTSWLFVGFFCLVQQNTWVTIEGGPLSLSGYYAWASWEPDNFGVQNCGMITRDSLYGSHDCFDTLLPFICEKPNY